MNFNDLKVGSRGRTRTRFDFVKTLDLLGFLQIRHAGRGKKILLESVKLWEAPSSSTQSEKNDGTPLLHQVRSHETT